MWRKLTKISLSGPILVAVVLIVWACGEGGASAPDAAATTAPTATATTVTVPTTLQPTTTVTEPEPTAVTEANPVTDTEPVATTSTHAVMATMGVPYTGTQLLDVWAPTAPGPWPVLVMLHGWGGPAATSARSGYDDLAAAIAGGGVVVYNAEWPIRDRFIEEAGIVACAIGFARASAADYGGSPERVTVLGHSAGGSMATTVAFSADLLEPAQDCVGDGLFVPDAVVGVAADYAYAISGPAARLKDEDPAAWEVIDPYSNIGRNPDLDVYLLHGTIDDWVDVQSAIDFEKALAAAGYTVHLTVLDGVGHNSLVAPTFDAFQMTVAVAIEAAQG